MKISDRDAFRMLEKYRIPVAKYYSVPAEERSIDEAKRYAEKLGYPLVIKIDAPDIIHKMSLGCVKFVKQGELDRKFKSLLKNAKKVSKHKNNVIMQEFLTGVELIIGALADEQFGPAILFGIGGPLVEKINKVSFRLLPISKKDAEVMIEEAGLEKFLKQKKSYELTIKMLRNTARMMIKNPDIVELDINPFLVPVGKAIDVRIIKRRWS